MQRSEQELLKSSFAKVIAMIDMYADEMQLKAATMSNKEYDTKYFKQKEEVRVIKSMKEIEGW